MNIFSFHHKLVQNYKSYIQSFLTIKDPSILEFVGREIDNNKLWPEPLIQFNPTFEKGRLMADLISDGLLHRDLNTIFKDYNLYRHQEEAILLGAAGNEFVVTSGTGSGKSLTYIATIFNHILRNQESVSGKIQAIIVYPMNALINSQFEELRKFEINFYEQITGTKWDRASTTAIEILDFFRKTSPVKFPVTYAQYTGQESEEEKEKIKQNPPHILLTNYVMLELSMTRSGRDVEIRQNFLENLRFLVFDELHTYRGRQGSDVSILIRRIKAAAKKSICCIGTSATMVSGENTTIREQKEKVAEVASTIFGSELESFQVINEYLVRSISGSSSATKAELHAAVSEKINLNGSESDFENHPTANWIEEQVALDVKEGVLVRRKPSELSAIALRLAGAAGTEMADAQEHLELLLEWANILNTKAGKTKNYLPYRIHQFIAQTGSVYATLGNQEARQLFLDAGLYADDKDTQVFPMVFSRISGHEFTCVKLNLNDSKIKPREFNDFGDEEDDQDSTEDGYIFIQHKEDQELIWEESRDLEELPETWFLPARKDGSKSLKKERLARLPRQIWFNKTGEFSFSEKLEFDGWFIPAPLNFDPTSGKIYEAKTAEWTKLMKLGGEGRSTATTVMSFETITQLEQFGEASKKQKLLSFTDNRQDASLQAGHFNDFIKVGQLRAAIAKALQTESPLDYSTISEKVFKALDIPQQQFARQASEFPGPKKDNEDAFKDFIMYRLLHDLRRSWRVVMPNLEQCALLQIDYRHLSETVAMDSLWSNNPLLATMNASQRREFLKQIFDFFRKSFAIQFSMLEPGAISTNMKRIREKLKQPWTLDDNEKLDLPAYVRIEKSGSGAYSLYSESAGALSVFGRYIKSTARQHGIELRKKEELNDFINMLFELLVEAGWLVKKQADGSGKKQDAVFQLKADNILWTRGDGQTIVQDLIKNRSYRPIAARPNEYFKKFYQTRFNEIKPIEGREHTGQISSNIRKAREEEFREGKIGALFCSPTMELGIDISDLSIVHMRNVPPSPANYAQRSGRAGRSGQAALVLVYCSNFSAHDRHYFKNSSQMVAGSVSAPRLDLVNEELLLSHLNASILTIKSISSLNNSIGELVDLNKLESLPLKPEVLELINLTDQEKARIHYQYKKVMDDTYFRKNLAIRKPSWFTDEWIMHHINSFQLSLDQSLNRWRLLYRAAQNQVRAALAIIENRVYADNHEKKLEAHRSVKQGERQRELLLNKSTEAGSFQGKNKEQTEFYPYRYLASEGFLPGYNFTRLPIRSYMENKESGGEYISRARFIALNEFGPRNLVYHDGSKYRIDKLMLTEAEFKMKKGKICPKTGYFLFDDQYGYEVDPITGETLQLDIQKHIHTTLLEMGETRAYELQRITCQEEERTKKGYDIQTYFSVDGGLENTTEGIVKVAGEKVLHLHYIPTCRIFKLNLKWRATNEQGFTINLQNGFWQNKKQKEEKADQDQIRDVKLFTSDTANALYIQPVTSLGLEGGNKGVITLMFALKRALENYFQVESSEIGATIMGEESAPNILLYEASEGSLGVLSQLVDNPALYRNVIEEAYKICFFENGVEQTGEVLPATYDDLLSFYNQYYHEQINRNYLREALRMLKTSTVEILAGKSFDSYEEQYRFLVKARDQSSSTEEKFLKFLYQAGLKLPDAAQPLVNNIFVQPDFFYAPNIYVFCDGTPHDNPATRQEDLDKRSALKSSGFQVLSWHYRDSLKDFIESRPDIFKKVKENDKGIQF